MSKSKRTPVSPADADTAGRADDVTLIPLSQLQRKPSKINVRTIEPTGIEALADNIAAVGLLQNLIVVPCSNGRFEVAAGGRRLRALQSLVKRRKLPADFAVPCQIRQADAAILASLSENMQREAMHPADECEAFARLVGVGKAIEDIAASFGVTPLVVQRRLKLAAVSPRLMTDFRAGALSLEQMMALTLSDDHAAQESAFYDAPEWCRTASHIRQRLVGEDVRATDRRVRYVGLDAYRAAGGGIREDLFADEDRAPVSLTDPALLDRLVDEQLQNVATQVQAEGWQWVRVVPNLSYSETQSMRRVSHERAAPTAEQTARLAALEEAIDARQRELSEAEAAEDDQRYGQAEDAINELQRELDEFRDSLRVLPDFARTVAGAFVSLDSEGVVEVDSGWVRREDFSKLNALLADRSKRRELAHAGSGDGGSDNDGARLDEDPGGDGVGLSASLARDLSAHRTAALQLEVARRPHVALALLVNRLVADELRCRHFGKDDSVTIRPASVDPLGDSKPPPMVVESMRELHARADALLSPNPDERFDQLLAMNDAELLQRLAVFVGASIDARVSRPTERTKACGIAEAVALDMSAHWSATVATYFGHVTKKFILEAVGEFAPAHVNRLAALKRKEMAEEAERLAHGTGWLPPSLRRPMRLHALQRAKPSTSVVEASDRLTSGQADDAEVAVPDDKLDADRDSESEAA